MATTARDFDAVAAIIDKRWSESMSDEAEAVLVDTACHLADYFASQNERFDRARFLLACGLDAERSDA
jgi:xanthine dehydrogenase iron-sulfur cluster and FAD-binding subunit A